MKKIFAIVVLLLSVILLHAQSPETTDNILTQAYTKAKAENKNVFVIFHASWCGWCKRLDASLNDASTKKYFDENFVITHLVVQESKEKKNLENPGADAFLEKYKGTKEGLPFFVLLDNKGNLIGDSFFNGSNMGCPASEKEVAAFITLLTKATKIDATGLSAITKRFRENESH
jgi:thioredoxin-related protein